MFCFNFEFEDDFEMQPADWEHYDSENNASKIIISYYCHRLMRGFLKSQDPWCSVAFS